jgi:alpha-mannosidase
MSAPAPISRDPGKPDLCFSLLNHWSYTGIGWNLGLESCAQSITDSLDMADFEPSVSTGINLDALTYELVAEHFPHVIRRLRKYLGAGHVEIVGGTFGQPMGSMVSGESNLRQLVVGQQTITRVLGRPVAVFLEEEEMSHPQIPQMLVLAGYRYASLAQCDTWGRHGAPSMDESVIWWEGADGTRLLAVPFSPLVFHPPMVTHDIDWLWTDEGRTTLARLQRDRPPLALKWTEFGWEKLTGKSINKFDPALFRTLSEKFSVEYLTVEQYLDRHRHDPAIAAKRLAVDDFDKLLPWGIGGDQIRRFGREVEAVLLAAERFEAVAHVRQLGVNDARGLHEAWRQLLAAQSHDVSLCEYTRHQGAAPPPDPVLDAHFQTWGSYGYGLMDDAVATGRAVLDRSLRAIARAVGTGPGARPGWLAAVVFNPCGFPRDALVTTGNLQLEDLHADCVQLRNSAGEAVVAQILSSERDAGGRLVCAELAFAARALPSVGYDTFYLDPTPAAVDAPASGLRVDPGALLLENEFVQVTLDPVSGAIRHLRDRRTGREMLAGATRPFPTLTGEANGASPLARPPGAPVEPYNTALTQASFTWLETGPLRARVRATHPDTRGLRFEITVTLTAASPEVGVEVRVFPDLPPKPGEAKVNGWQFPLEIKEGYWLEFAPAFAVETVLRDYPFGAEPSRKQAFTALSWLDLLAADGSGLLLLHSGTQYFKRHANGTIANLVVREWESHFTGEFGWPRTCVFRYALRPHDAAWSPADRAHAAAAFDQKPRCVVLPPQPGSLPKRQGFVSVAGRGALLSAFRRPRADAADCELRLVECEGRTGPARLQTALPLALRRPTDAMGQALGPAAPLVATDDLALRPWEIKHFNLQP